MNIFSVLGVNYEVFHSRMLHWLWTTTGDHGAGDRYWKAACELLGVHTTLEPRIADEVKIDVPGQVRWRLADLVIRTADLLILVENKVDPAYQDAQQIADELEGGRALATAEGRRFLFVLVAPGPLTSGIKQLLEASGGVFVAWNALLDRLQTVPVDDLEPVVAQVIGQYLQFARKPVKTFNAPATDAMVREAEGAIRGIVQRGDAGQQFTAIEVWVAFTREFPDHVAALDGRWADSSHYSAKAWFAAKLQRMAAAKDLIEETGEWRAGSAAWGYPKVRVYRRLG